MAMFYTISAGMFYTISAGKRNAQQVSGPVRAIKTQGLVGHLNMQTGEICVPDADAVRECLPYAWRKAWDRAAKTSFTFTNEDGYDKHRPCYKRLLTSKGRYLTTIYATPYYTA